MAAPKRTDIQRERDLTEIASLYLKGWTQQAIADDLSARYYRDAPLSQQQIGYDIQKLVKRWQASQVLNLDEAKARELARIDQLERTYWEAWERSLGDFKSKTIKAKGGDLEAAKANAEQTLKTEDRNGDPRYLQGVQWCIERRCKILGIDAPDKSANVNIDVSQLSEAELVRIANGEDPLHVLATKSGG